MILSSDELEILAYLKGFNGKHISMVEICRRASGRNKYEESPHWAKGLMFRLVEAKLVDVNERGHYRLNVKESPPKAPTPKTAKPPPVSDPLVDGNYFPTAGGPDQKPERWVAPEIAKLLRGSGKKFST